MGEEEGEAKKGGGESGCGGRGPVLLSRCFPPPFPLPPPSVWPWRWGMCSLFSQRGGRGAAPSLSLWLPRRSLQQWEQQSEAHLTIFRRSFHYPSVRRFPHHKKTGAVVRRDPHNNAEAPPGWKCSWDFSGPDFSARSRWKPRRSSFCPA